ncbi:MAG: hypothetical protein M1823_007058, partial [Watsoniomyces obsoletus]
RKDKERPEPSTKPRRKFAPEPIETQTVSRRRKAPEPEKKHDYADYTAEDGPAGPSEEQQTPSRTSSGGRKFSPELIETAKATYRRSVIASPIKIKRTKPPSPPPEEETDEVKPIQESRFSAAALAKKRHKEERNERKQSLMVPELPTI